MVDVRRVTLLLALLLLALLLLAGSLAATAPAAVGSVPRPNVVIIMSDDQRYDMLTPRFMPNVYDRLIAGNPYAFTNSFVPNPLCCPSRTSTLTGNYSHTTGVWFNAPPYGGFQVFDDRHTMAVDFQQAGYRTAMIGKYLNGYVAGKNRYVAPGWDRWFAVNTGAYYNYGVTTNNKLLHYGKRPRKDYIVNVLEPQAESFITNAQQAGQPFFLYYAFTAPHGPSIPAPRDVGRFADVTPADTGTPNVDEERDRLRNAREEYMLPITEELNAARSAAAKLREALERIAQRRYEGEEYWAALDYDEMFAIAEAVLDETKEPTP